MLPKVVNHGFEDRLVSKVVQAEVAGHKYFGRFHARPAIGVCSNFSFVRRRLGESTEDPNPRPEDKTMVLGRRQDRIWEDWV